MNSHSAEIKDYLTLRGSPIVMGESRMSPSSQCVRTKGLQDWLIWYTVQGQAHVCHGSGRFLTTLGELVLIAPNTPQNYGTGALSNTWRPLWAVFDPRPHWMEWLRWPTEAKGIMRLRPSETAAGRPILKALRCALQATQTANRNRLAMAMNHLERAFLWCDAVNDLSRSTALDTRVTRAMEFMSTHLDQPLEIGQVARAANLSVPHLSKLFREQVGHPPLRYLERRRLERAGELLRFTLLRVEEIAREVGYENPFYFSLRFKRQYGQCPRDFRQS